MQDLDNSLEKAQRLIDEITQAQQAHDSSPFEYSDALSEWLPVFRQLVEAGQLSQAALDTLLNDQEPGPHRNRIFVEMYNQARLVALEQKQDTIHAAETLEQLIENLPGELGSDAWWAALNDAYNDESVLVRIKISHDRIVKITGIPERSVKRKVKKRK